MKDDIDFQIGDEIVDSNTGHKSVIWDIREYEDSYGKYKCINSISKGVSMYNNLAFEDVRRKIKKTGKHYPEIERILNRMKEVKG